MRTLCGNSLDATQPGSWIEIHADNTLLIRTGKCDFGQSSIYTAYRQIVAEELDVPVDAITTVISGDTDRTPDGGGTFGLLRNNVLNLRKAAAYTREAALELAAQQFGVPRAELTVADGVISGGGKSVTYGALVTGKMFQLSIPVSGKLTDFGGLQVTGNPPLKPASRYTVIGKPVKNPSLRPKISGETTWVNDVKLPGMLHARVVHPATLGSTLIAAGKVDKSQFPNTQVVVIGNLVGVVATGRMGGDPRRAGGRRPTRNGPSGRACPDIKNCWSICRSRSTGARSRRPKARAQGDVAASVLPRRRKRTAQLTSCRITSTRRLRRPYRLPTSSPTARSRCTHTARIRSSCGWPSPRCSASRKPTSSSALIQAPVISAVRMAAMPVPKTRPCCCRAQLGKPVRVQWMRADDMQWSTQSSTSMSADSHRRSIRAARFRRTRPTTRVRRCRTTGRSARCSRVCRPSRPPHLTIRRSCTARH